MIQTIDKHLLDLKEECLELSKRGIRLPAVDVEEPDCNILRNDRYNYRDETWVISTQTTTTHMDRVYEDWFVEVTYKGQLVLRVTSYSTKAIYIAGQWENELEDL